MEALQTVFATVGTDHHPFGRLVTWVDDWYREEGLGKVRCVVQWGTSPPPLSCEGDAYMPYGKMQELMSRAAAVVTHGGPATIMECRAKGLVPLVLPRRHALGEHVDDHQVDFNRRLAADGEVFLCDTEEALRGHLSAALSDPSSFRRDPVRDASPEAVRRFMQLVDPLVGGR